MSQDKIVGRIPTMELRWCNTGWSGTVLQQKFAECDRDGYRELWVDVPMAEDRSLDPVAGKKWWQLWK